MMLRSHRAGRLRGYTLLEMIVVLAIVASFLAIALPAVFRPLTKAELRDAAQQVQAALLDARTRAVESGVAQEFRYEPGGRRYEIRARGQEGDGTPPAAPNLAAAGATAQPANVAVLEPLDEVLPDGIVFADPQEEIPRDHHRPATGREHPAGLQMAGVLVGVAAPERIAGQRHDIAQAVQDRRVVGHQLAGGEAADVRMGDGRCDQPLQPVRRGVGVGVEQRQPAAAGGARALVHRRGEAQVVGVLDQTERRVGRGRRLGGAVAGGVVHQQDLVVGEALGLQRRQALGQRGAALVDHDHDTDRRRRLRGLAIRRATRHPRGHSHVSEPT